MADFARIIEAALPGMNRWARRTVVRHPSIEADDLVQETCLRAMRSQVAVEQADHPKALISYLMYQTLVAMLTSQRAEKRGGRAEHVTDDWDAPVAPSQEARAEANQVAGRLKVQSPRVFAMLLDHGVDATNAEIAAGEGISHQRVAQLFASARKRLKDSIHE